MRDEEKQREEATSEAGKALWASLRGLAGATRQCKLTDQAKPDDGVAEEGDEGSFERLLSTNADTTRLKSTLIG